MSWFCLFVCLFLTWPDDKRARKGAGAEYRQMVATELIWYRFPPWEAEDMVDAAIVRGLKVPHLGIGSPLGRLLAINFCRWKSKKVIGVSGSSISHLPGIFLLLLFCFLDEALFYEQIWVFSQICPSFH